MVIMLQNYDEESHSDGDDKNHNRDHVDDDDDDGDEDDDDVDDDDVNGDDSEAPHVMRMRAWRSARLGICGRLERGILTLGHSSDNPGLLFSDTPTLKQS